MLTVYLAMVAEPEEKTALEQAYVNYKNQMFYLARTMLESDADAEDAVHGVFVCLAGKNRSVLKKLDTPDKLRNYLLKAVKNTCLNEIKRRSRTPISLDQEDAFLPAVSDEDFVRRICTAMEARQLVAHMLALPEHYRDALYYHFVLELSVPQVAALTGQTGAAVKKQLVRGKKKLLEAIKGGDPDE